MSLSVYICFLLNFLLSLLWFHIYFSLLKVLSHHTTLPLPLILTSFGSVCVGLDRFLLPLSAPFRLVSFPGTSKLSAFNFISLRSALHHVNLFLTGSFRSCSFSSLSSPVSAGTLSFDFPLAVFGAAASSPRLTSF